MRLRRSLLTSRSARHAVPFTLVAGLAAVACAGAAMAPELSVLKAASELGDARRAAYTLSLQGDRDDLVGFNDALLAAGYDDADTPEGFEDFLAVLGSSIKVVWDKGDDAEAVTDDAVALVIDVDEMDEAVEARFVDGTLYARAQARKLARLFKVPGGTIDRFLAEAEGLGLDFADEAVSGGWLAHDLDPIVSFFKGIARNPAFEDSMREETGFGFSDLSPEALSGVIDSFSEVYGNDVDVTRGSADGPGDHYVLTASAKKVYEQLLPAVRDLPLLKDGLEALPSVADVPDDTYSLQLWVRNGTITRAEFDFAQIVPAGTFPAGLKMPRLALRLDIDRSAGPVTAPGEATRLDIFELFGKLAAGAGATES